MLHSHLPNVAVQWVALCIWDKPGSNLNLHIGYPVVPCGIPQSLQTNTREGLKLGCDCLIHSLLYIA
jgi:hypothetical protein